MHQCAHFFAKKPYIYTYFVCKKNGTQKGWLSKVSQQPQGGAEGRDSHLWGRGRKKPAEAEGQEAGSWLCLRARCWAGTWQIRSRFMSVKQKETTFRWATETEKEAGQENRHL